MIDWPGWIQAVSAIAAIFTAYWIVRYEERETRREQLARQLQFAVFTVETLHRAFRRLNDVLDAWTAFNDATDHAEGAISARIRDDVLNAQRATTSIDELNLIPQTYWPSASLYLAFRESYARWQVLQAQIAGHGDPRYVVAYRSERDEAETFDSNLGEAAHFGLGSFYPYLDRAMVMIGEPSYRDIPRRYLQRLGSSYDDEIGDIIDWDTARRRRRAAA